MRQIYKRKSNLITYCVGNPHKHEKFQRPLGQLRLICHFELSRRGSPKKEKKGKEGSSQEEEESKRLVNKCLLGHRETTGQGGKF